MRLRSRVSIRAIGGSEETRPARPRRRCPVRRRLLRPRPAADDDTGALLKIARQYLRHAAVADAETDRNRCGRAVRPDDIDPCRRSAVASIAWTGLGGDCLELGASLRIERRGDPVLDLPAGLAHGRAPLLR